MAPQLGVQPSLLVQHARHLVRETGGLEAFSRPPQEVAGSGQVALPP